jgi:plastocyanin
MKTLRLAILPAIVCLALPAAAATVEVSQKGRVFHPDSIAIAAGDTIRFKNDDEFLHHIYIHSPDLTFDSAEQPPGQTIEIKFPRPGDFNVRCEIHPKMHLAVHVK